MSLGKLASSDPGNFACAAGAGAAAGAVAGAMAGVAAMEVAAADGADAAAGGAAAGGMASKPAVLRSRRLLRCCAECPDQNTGSCSSEPH